MQDAKYSITVQFVVVKLEKLVIHSEAVIHFQLLQLKKMNESMMFAFHHHVDRIHCVKQMVKHHYANASVDTSVHHQIVAQNAW